MERCITEQENSLGFYVVNSEENLIRGGSFFIHFILIWLYSSSNTHKYIRLIYVAAAEKIDTEDTAARVTDNART